VFSSEIELRRWSGWLRSIMVCGDEKGIQRVIRKLHNSYSVNHLDFFSFDTQL
jgi:hypothetical protein